MAECQYNGDSPFPPLFSLRPGMPGSPESSAVKPIAFPALSAIEAPSVIASYILNGSAAMYIGESIDYARRLRDHGAVHATRPQGGATSITTSID
ncbi:hypothetical protein [Bradyrhizobium japonicum]|uniref:hypothetical protein n=1 Tax=Bradyrhizobium japonicum TaxID=375 RepID=UPI000411C0F1|nr:hypothetical protein [Bradyrhizobium japonicum]